MKKIIKQNIILFLCFLCSGFYAQITTLNDSLGLEDIANTILGEGVIVNDVQMSCPDGAFAAFTSVNLPVNEGVVFSTGLANEVQGPNDDNDNSFDFGIGGDNQLDVLAGFPTYDACVIEFDFQIQCDTLEFAYYFGSEEFLDEYYNSGFNDVFAFFLSGPNPGGGNYNNENLAVVPGTSTPVSIHTINPYNNAQYYNDNSNGNIIQFGGYTDRFEVKLPLQSCEDYHLKIAIADGTDHIFDSGVFIEANSINCTNSLYAEYIETSHAIENCLEGSFTICRQENIEDDLIVPVEILGSAENGVDYEFIDNEVLIPALQECITIPVVPILDGIAEPMEYVKLVYQPGPCNYFDTVALSIQDNYKIDAGEDTLTCFGNDVKIGITPQTGIDYSWSPEEDFINAMVGNPIVAVDSDTNNMMVQTYVLTADSAGCQAFDSVQVTFMPKPDVDFLVDNACLGNDIQFTNLSVPNSGNMTSYFWNFDNGYADTVTNPLVSYTLEGLYEIYLKATNSFGCWDTITKEMNIWPLPTANFFADNTCLRDTVYFMDESVSNLGDPIASWFWTFTDSANVFISNAQNPKFLYQTSGSKNVQLIISSDKGCIDVINENIFVYPKPNVNFSAENLCKNKQALFHDFTTISYGNLAAWQWYLEGTPVYNESDPEHTFGEEGMYDVSLVVTADNGCKDSAYQEMEVYLGPVADFEFTDDVACTGTCITFKDFSEDAYDNLQYDWDFDRGDHSFDTEPTYCFDLPGSYNLSLQVTNVHGCKDKKIWAEPLEILEAPHASFSVSQNISEDYASPAVLFTDQSSSDVVQWNWLLEDGYSYSTDNNKAFYHYFQKPGAYYATLNVMNENGCIDSAILLVQVAQSYTAYIPNAFTPGDNSVNDTFYPVIYLNEDQPYEMYIFNRWGDQVYATKESGKWNGVDERTGKLLKQDVYAYKIIIKDEQEDEVTFSGRVTLLR